MWDGSAIELTENLKIAAELLELANKAQIILEVEIGVVGGEEDGVANEINEKLYTTDADFEQTIDALGSGEKGRYLLAATFGNVHGVYKPGNVSCARRCSSRARRVAAAKRACRPAASRSTWSSTAAPARSSRRSARRCPMAL